MSLYDLIQNPFQDDLTLEKLIDIYVNGRENGGTEEITNGDGMYKRITDYGSNNNSNQIIYQEEMSKYIRLPNLQRLYSNLQRLDIDQYDRKCEDIIKSIREKYRNNPTEEEQQLQIFQRANIYPLKKFKSILNGFDSYEKFSAFCNKHQKAITEIQRANLYPSTNGLNKIRDIGYSDDQIERLKLCSTFYNYLDRAFSGGPNVMGFHVNPQAMLQNSTDRVKDEIKFYLNAGEDTYRFAQLFQQKCEEKGINYYYKVVDAYKESEYKRTDKMCIYSEFKNAQQILDIIRELREQNIDINFENPPLLTGTIDDFIGVGTDHISLGGKSYNHEMSKICFNAMEKVFKGIPKKDIQSVVKSNPSKLEELRQEIITRAKSLGLSEEKVCVRTDIKQKLETINSGKNQKSSMNPTSNSLREFIVTLVESYKTLETNSQYDKRLAMENRDIANVVKVINDSSGEAVEYLGIEKELQYDEHGIIETDFSDDNINRMVRLLIASNNLTLTGDDSYLKKFCQKEEIYEILTEMQKSPKVQMIFRSAQLAKEQNAKGRGAERGLTPAEKDKELARAYLNSHSNRQAIIHDILQRGNNGRIEFQNPEESAIRRVLLRQQGITPIRIRKRNCTSRNWRARNWKKSQRIKGKN